MPARILELDGLRAVAVMAVVLFHAFGVKGLPGGYLGVDIFFVISGYIITDTLLREHRSSGTISITGFYRRRVRRLLPALFALSLVVTLIGLVSNWFKPESADYGFVVLVSLASIMNWVRALGISDGGIMGHAWSLSVEEQFYLFWPLMLLLFMKSPRMQAMLTPALVVAILASLLWRLVLFQADVSAARIYNGLDTRADALLIGVLLAVYGVANISQRWMLCVIPAALVLLTMGLVAEWQSAGMLTFGYTIAAACAAWLVAASVRPGKLTTTLLKSSVAVWIGVRSYSLYLWHYPIMEWARRTGLPDGTWEFVALLASFVAADLSFRFVERPFLKAGRPDHRRNPADISQQAAP